MYTIISGTNRVGSNTLKVARQYQQRFKAQGIEAALITLEGVNPLPGAEGFEAWQRELLHPAEKFIFIAPEYNGSLPGILKLVIDSSDVKVAWWYKKAMLVGVSTGRAGNLRGMDHLTGILHHLNVQVMPNKLPISGVDKLLNSNDEINDMGTLAAIDKQIGQFIVF
jgi:chromate reductase, NAD(P)H dehydrogenase (quinone)